MPKLAIGPSTRGLEFIGKSGFRVEQEYQNTRFFWKIEKIIKALADALKIIQMGPA